jgi:hypothetical protein
VPLMLVDAAPPIGASIREHGLEAYRNICPRRAAAVFLPIWTRVSPSRICCADVDDDQGGRDRFGYMRTTLPRWTEGMSLVRTQFFAIFSDTVNPSLAQLIAHELGTRVGYCVLERFPDGEVAGVCAS